jgi:hypothetical protein
VEADAAVAILGLERDAQASLLELREHAVEHAEIHPADEFGVRASEVVERTVVQHRHAVFERFGFEAEGAEFVEQCFAPGAPARTTIEAGSARVTESSSLLACRVVECARYL